MITPKEKKVVRENFLSLFSVQSLNYIFPLLILPYIIRVIGPEKFGLIAFAQALVQYFMILTDYGFSFSATRRLALCRNEEEKVHIVFSSVMTVKIVLTIVSFLILFMLVNLIPKFKGDWLVYLFSFGAVIGNTLFPVWFFQGTEKMRFITLINTIGGIIYLACIFIFIKAPQDYILVPLINSLFSLVTGILGLYTVFNKFNVEFVFQTYGTIKQELRAGWSVFISIVSINAYTTTRVFAVGLLTNNVLTGYYSIAERIANVIQTFPLDSLSQAMYPRLSHIFARNKTRALKIMRKMQNSTTFIYCLVIPAVILISPWIVKIVCGKVYKEVVITLGFLLLSVFFVTANAFRVQFLLVAGRADTYSKLHIATAFVGLPLIFLLIEYFSYLGAAISTVIIEVWIFIWTLMVIKELFAKSRG